MLVASEFACKFQVSRTRSHYFFAIMQQDGCYNLQLNSCYVFFALVESDVWVKGSMVKTLGYIEVCWNNRTAAIGKCVLRWKNRFRKIIELFKRLYYFENCYFIVYTFLYNARTDRCLKFCYKWNWAHKELHFPHSYVYQSRPLYWLGRCVKAFDMIFVQCISRFVVLRVIKNHRSYQQQHSIQIKTVHLSIYASLDKSTTPHITRPSTT